MATDQSSGNYNKGMDLMYSMNMEVISNKCNVSDFASSYAKTTREKSKKCSLCVYASSRAGDLRTHLKTHGGEKPNKCNQCDCASSQAGSLRTHLKKHNQEKSNKCSQCDFASSYAINVMQMHMHLQMHPLMQ